jgi:hypothetical protein
MISMNEQAQNGNGALASDADAPQGEDGFAALFAMVSARVVDHLGRLDMDSVSMDMLRTQEGREKVLREFVLAMMPDRVNPALWVRWLQGQAAPFERAKLTPPAPPGVSIGRAVDRQSRSIAKARTGVQNAHRAVEAAKRRLIEAENELAIARSKDAAFIEYLVGEHLLHLMAPMFAMGPAWTIMRVVSGHVDAVVMADALSQIRDKAQRPKREEVIRRERQEGSEKILDMLDYWAGDIEFEYELRDAIEKVATRYQSRKRDDGVRRPRSSMKNSVANPELMRERDEVLAGMKRSDD